MPGTPPWFTLPTAETLNSIVIVGAGLAGCHLAYELATQGHDVVLLDAQDTVASGASGNQAGVIKPFVTRSPSTIDDFYEHGFNTITALLQRTKALANAAKFQQCGVLQLTTQTYPQNALYKLCSQTEASTIAGVPINSDALFFANAGWLNPAGLCAELVKHPRIKLKLNHCVQKIERISSQWQVVCDNGKTLSCQKLVLATGHLLSTFEQTSFLPVIAARGQVSEFSLKTDRKIKTVVSNKHYVIPNGDRVWIGASFERNSIDTRLSIAEHNDNRDALNAMLPTLNTDRTASEGFCGVRATTPDRLPLLGPVPSFVQYQHDYRLLKDGLPWSHYNDAPYLNNLFVFGGLGSRGIVSAAFSAQLLAQLLTGSKTINSASNKDHNIEYNLNKWASLIHPARFLVRDIKRGATARNSVSVK